MGRGDESEKRLKRGRCGIDGIILLRQLNNGRRVFAGGGLMLEIFLGWINRTLEFGDGGLSRGEKGGEGWRGLYGRRMYGERLHLYFRYSISDAGMYSCSPRTFISCVIAAKGLLQCYY